MFGSRIFILFSILASFALRAEVVELAPGLTVDTNKFSQKLEACGGVETPGTTCLYQCYNINNETSATYYDCALEATAIFNEQISSSPTDLYTGNTLTATDYRTAVVYPYQTVSLCFNYGKEITSTNSLWVYSSSTITDGGTCAGGTVGDAPGTGTATLE